MSINAYLINTRYLFQDECICAWFLGQFSARVGESGLLKGSSGDCNCAQMFRLEINALVRQKKAATLSEHNKATLLSFGSKLRRYMQESTWKI